MLIFITILVLSGLIMEIGEGKAAAVYEDESKAPAALLFFMSFVTAAYVLSGILFATLSLFHIGKNWNTLKNHPKSKSGKEILFAFILLGAILSLALLVAFMRF
jgi:hypothetical protein